MVRPKVVTTLRVHCFRGRLTCCHRLWRYIIYSLVEEAVFNSLQPLKSARSGCRDSLGYQLNITGATSTSCAGESCSEPEHLGCDIESGKLSIRMKGRSIPVPGVVVLLVEAKSSQWHVDDKPAHQYVTKISVTGGPQWPKAAQSAKDAVQYHL